MPERLKINEEVTIAPQPDEAEIQSLPEVGFRSVVNLRAEGEDAQQIAPQAEGEMVKAAGMQYLHLPVAMSSLDEELVNTFRRHYRGIPKPMYVHCELGKRAGALVLMHIACERGLTSEEAMEQAHEMGFDCEQPQMKEFVKTYIESYCRTSEG